MERVTQVTDLQAASKRVERHAGSPGIDGMRTDEQRVYLRNTGRNSCERCSTRLTARKR